jgi:hypothetical protein
MNHIVSPGFFLLDMGALMRALTLTLTFNALQACAIEPSTPVEVVRPPVKIPAPMQVTGNQAVIVTKNRHSIAANSSQPAVPWLNFDATRMKTALESSPDHFKVSVIEPENPEMLSKAIRESAMASGPDGTLVLLFAGYANERGELTLNDGSRFTYASIMSATGSPVPKFTRLVTIVAASLDASWVDETAALSSATNFADSVIVTSLPRLSVEGSEHDETTLSLLHPAGSRLLATLRDAVAKKGPKQDHTQGPANGILSAIKLMQENHDLLYGPGPVVRTGANSKRKS